MFRAQFCPLCDFRFVRPTVLTTRDIFSAEMYRCDCGLQFACITWTFRGSFGKTPLMCIQASTNPEDFELNRRTIFPVMDKEIAVMIRTKDLWNKRIDNLEKLTEAKE